MKHNDLPQRWKEKIENYLIQSGKSYKKLSAFEFNSSNTVNLKFPDGSSARFRYAFVIYAPELNEIGVFTEHCGYHIFPFEDTEIELYDLSV
jgi:hypothetical protein